MSLFSWLRGEPNESERQERWLRANRVCKHPTGCRCHWCGLAAGLPPSGVPAQQLSDAGEDLVRLAAAKDAEIAALTEQRDILTDRLKELVAFSEQHDLAMKVVEAMKRYAGGADWRELDDEIADALAAFRSRDFPLSTGDPVDG